MYDDCNANNLWLYAMHSTQHHGTQCDRKYDVVQKIEIKNVTEQQKMGEYVQNQKIAWNLS